MTKGKKLTAKQQAFVDEYLKDLNATQACIRAGYSAKTADRIGPELLGKTWVAAAIQIGMEKRQKRLEISADMVLKRWWDIANADPNELVQYRRDCCRHCYGIDHRYQWIDQDEFNAAVDTAKARKAKVLPSDAGGFGFVATMEPNAKCPKCNGLGHGHMHVSDTRKLSPAALALFAGVKSGKEGLHVLMQSQEQALINVARHLGMFNDKLEVTVNESLAARLAKAKQRISKP